MWNIGKNVTHSAIKMTVMINAIVIDMTLEMLSGKEAMWNPDTWVYGTSEK